MARPSRLPLTGCSPCPSPPPASPIAPDAGRYGFGDPCSVFSAMDGSGNGTLDRGELHQALSSLGLGLSIAQSELLFEAVDADGSGGVSFAEFADICGVAQDGDGGGVSLAPIRG